MITQNLLILWDIDGTLIKLPKKSSRKHLEVVQEYTNFQISDPGSSLGKTDIGLIKDIFEFNQIYLVTQGFSYLNWLEPFLCFFKRKIESTLQLIFNFQI